MSLSFHALGTTAVIATTDSASEGDACAVVEREIDAIDRACSRFRLDSELTRVNRAGGKRVAIGPLLLEALRVALDAARSSGGLVDLTVGRALRSAGYDSTFRVVAARDGTTFRAEFCTVLDAVQHHLREDRRERQLRPERLITDRPSRRINTVDELDELVVHSAVR